MKYIKKYEKKHIVEVGDYVIIKPNSKFGSYANWFKEYIENNIGKITKTYIQSVEVFYSDMTCTFNKDEILHISKNKEDLEVALNSKKYNL